MRNKWHSHREFISSLCAHRLSTLVGRRQTVDILRLPIFLKNQDSNLKKENYSRTMTIIENCFIYNGKKLKKPDCEKGNVQPKLKRDRWRRSIHITERVVSTPRANFFLSCLLWTLFAIVLSAATILLLVMLSPFPLRPSCLILWKTNARSCDEVRNALLYRLEDWMQAFPACTNCSRYQVVSAEPQSLWLWHRSEWQSAVYEADISLFFSPRPNNTCHILAQCLSRGWLWPLDGGASFCTLSRLAADSSFLGPLATQLTDDPVCTQFSSAVCPTTHIPKEVPADVKLMESLLEEEDWLRSQSLSSSPQLKLHANSQ